MFLIKEEDGWQNLHRVLNFRMEKNVIVRFFFFFTKKFFYFNLKDFMFLIKCVKCIICKVIYNTTMHTTTHTVSQKWIIEELPLRKNAIVH